MIDKNREIKITECASRFVSAILQQGFKLDKNVNLVPLQNAA